MLCAALATPSAHISEIHSGSASICYKLGVLRRRRRMQARCSMMVRCPLTLLAFAHVQNLVCKVLYIQRGELARAQ